MFKNLIIADDFTGANDTGMQLRRRGYRTAVFFRQPEQLKENISVVIDTESRGLKAANAYEKVKTAVKNINFSEYKYVIKKVDSTLRGNIPWEIKAVDESYQSELIIFMPALPDLNRTTVNGIHKLNGVPLTETEIAKDPKSPVTQAHIGYLLQEAYEEKVHTISLDEINEGHLDFDLGRLYAVDAQTNAQMQQVIQSALQTGKKVLFAGTAAMADNIFELEAPAVPAMGLIASVSEVTNGQVKYAASCGTDLIIVDIPAILKGELSASIYIEEAQAILKSGKDVLVISSASYERSELERTVKAGKELGMTREETSEWTQNAMGEIGKSILEGVTVSGLFLTGGDTAIGFFNMVNADGSEIIGEIATGVPLMRLAGGAFEGLKVVTKAGAFGNKDAVMYALRKLKE